MMKTIIAILLLTFSGSAYADSVRCKGVYTPAIGNQKLSIQIDIVIPDLRSGNLAFLSFENKPNRSIDTGVGEGIIEIKRELKNTTRYDFIVTRMPTKSGDSLIGFFLDHTYIYSLRADLWKAGMPFSFYDSLTNEFITGNCEK
jgi:hypothetical protein